MPGVGNNFPTNDLGVTAAAASTHLAGDPSLNVNGGGANREPRDAALAFPAQAETCGDDSMDGIKPVQDSNGQTAYWMGKGNLDDPTAQSFSVGRERFQYIRGRSRACPNPATTTGCATRRPIRRTIS